MHFNNIAKSLKLLFFIGLRVYVGFFLKSWSSCLCGPATVTLNVFAGLHCVGRAGESCVPQNFEKVHLLVKVPLHFSMWKH